MSRVLSRFLGTSTAFCILASTPVFAADATDETIAMQRDMLAKYAMSAENVGPQSPRDLSTMEGANKFEFEVAPPHTQMNLCDIHFHENAEHKGGDFTTYAGNGDGKGAGTGFKYDGSLTDAELTPYGETVGKGKYGTLEPGDTIELHYVHSTVIRDPGNGLGTCIAETGLTPDTRLRVETQVYVLVNDEAALDFMDLTKIEKVGDLHQAVNIPTNTGDPIQYAGSTTGPSYNEKLSPLNVSWSVRPKVAKVHIGTVATWLENNVFEESYAHGVRNLVINPDLISPIN